MPYLTDYNCMFDIDIFCLFLIAPKMQPKFCAINTFFAIRVFCYDVDLKSGYGTEFLSIKLSRG